ncbi:MAG: zf-HC2 domain-containing protein [Actinobacteria bacterium]|nr:zf-HC2 domain-containing protein [Actinomycetota bacterium]MBU1943327.1 zf-HC2 domain-containing protein [Actinomycetota bacterium]MBU2686555.1 zf-HC2 domain-containing protein [Actinomycetota bacterium]
MNCRQARKALIEYNDGSLVPEDSVRIDEHLASCPGCAAMAEQINLSGAALSSLQPVLMSDAAASRVRASIRAEAPSMRTGRSAAVFGFLQRPATLAVAGAVAAILVAVAVVVGVYTGPPEETTTVSEYSKEAGTSGPGMSNPASMSEDALAPGMARVGLPTPEVKVSNTDYNGESLRAMFEDLDVKKQYSANYSMGDAVQLRGNYTDRAALEFQAMGGDGGMYEAMVSYITSSEPVMLPCYLEKALFTGQSAYIIGLAAPSRSGDSKNLNRVEVWVMSPEKFTANPNTSILYFIEQRETQ